MSEDRKKKGNAEEFDIFILSTTFPQASTLFNIRLPSVENIKNNAIVVLDTNALLVPYNTGKDSLLQIGNTYRSLVAEGHLRIPGQVAREFAKNRANKITEIHQQFSRKVSGLNPLQKGRYPLLDSLKEYKEVLEFEENIDDLYKQYKEAVQKVLVKIRGWNWNDPVSELYGGIFAEEIIIDPRFDREELKAELNRRQVHKIPPGYKDSSKDDSGIGDLMIWFTILDIGKTMQSNIILFQEMKKLTGNIVVKIKPYIQGSN